MSTYKADMNPNYPPPNYTPGNGPQCPVGNYPAMSGANYTTVPGPGVVVAQPGVYVTNPIYSRPPDYLASSIMACLFCFWPTGLIAIIYACKSSRAFRDGDVEQSHIWSNRARNLMISSVVIGVIWITLVIALRLTVYSYHYKKHYY